MNMFVTTRSLFLAALCATLTRPALAQSEDRLLTCTSREVANDQRTRIYNFYLAMYKATHDGIEYFRVDLNERAGRVSWYIPNTFFSGTGNFVCQEVAIADGETLRCRGYMGDFGEARDPLDIEIHFIAESDVRAQMQTPIQVDMSCALSTPEKRE